MHNTPRYPGIFLLIMCCMVIFVSSCSSIDTRPTSTQPDIPINIGDTLYTYHGHHNGISAVAWSPDGKLIASASFDKTVQVWNALTGQLYSVYRGHSNWVTAVAWSPDGKYIASAGFDKTVQIWEALTGRHILTYYGHSDVVTDVKWSPNGMYLASTSYDKTVRIWNIGNNDTTTTDLVYRGHSDWVMTD